MRGLMLKVGQVFRTLYVSKEADRAIKEAESMADAVNKLLPVVCGILITALMVESKKWPARKG